MSYFSDTKSFPRPPPSYSSLQRNGAAQPRDYSTASTLSNGLRFLSEERHESRFANDFGNRSRFLDEQRNGPRFASEQRNGRRLSDDQRNGPRYLNHQRNDRSFLNDQSSLFHSPPYRYNADFYNSSSEERYQSKTLGRQPKLSTNSQDLRKPISNSNTYQGLASVLQQEKNLPPPYYSHNRSNMNDNRDFRRGDYDNVPLDSDYQNRGYPGTLSRNHSTSRSDEVNARNPSYLPNEYPSGNKRDYRSDRNYSSASSREYGDSVGRDYSSSTTNSDGLDVGKSASPRDNLISREPTMPRDQTLSGFSRNFGGSPGVDLRISRESLDRPNNCQTPPSRHSMTPPSLHSCTPPLRHSQASPLRSAQTPPMRGTPPFRPIQNNSTPPLRTPPIRDPNSRYSMSPKQRYRTAEDYHYDYRGGFRAIDSEGGYTTDGSGSIGLDSGSLRGILDSGSIRGFSNFLYPEHESLLPRNRSSFPPCQTQGSSYAKGKTAFMN